MTEYKTVCVPRTVCRQVPVEVCVKVPVVVHCPPVVLPSAQSVMASGQSVPVHHGAAVRPVRQPLPARRQKFAPRPLSRGRRGSARGRTALTHSP